MKYVTFTDGVLRCYVRGELVFEKQMTAREAVALSEALIGGALRAEW